MAQASGIKNNKCFATGVQGVCKQIESTAASPNMYGFSSDAVENNCRFVLKDYVSALIGSLPTEPTPDFNFDITMQNSSGFYGTIAGVFSFADHPTTGSGDFLSIKWNNPDFDVSDNWTVIHLHIWHDGINWCGNIDGYVETTT